MLTRAPVVLIKVDQRPPPADENYENETPFQLYWLACNFALTLLLTFFVMVGSDNLAGVNIFETLSLGDLSVVQNRNVFIAIISTIFATGILSQIIFFVMKSIKCGITWVLKAEGVLN